MSNAAFTLALKSTIDYLTKQIADAKGLPFIDMASAEFDTNIVESDQPAMFWDFGSFDEDPFDPFYSATFEIGAMTMLDPSQYVSLEIIGEISEKFKVHSDFDISDYSGDVATGMVGKFRVISCGLSPAMQDQATNIRTVSITVKAVRYD